MKFIVGNPPIKNVPTIFHLTKSIVLQEITNFSNEIVNTFDMMGIISVETKTNLFDKRVSENA